MPNDVVILERVDFDRLRQCTRLADALLGQLDAALRIVDAGCTDRDALHLTELVTAHERKLLLPGTAREAARRLCRMLTLFEPMRRTLVGHVLNAPQLVTLLKACRAM